MIFITLLFCINAVVADSTVRDAAASELNLTAANGKITGDGINREKGRFVGWTSTKVEIFWDIEFTKTGEFEVALSMANRDYQAGIPIELIFGDGNSNTTITGNTTFSGGLNKVVSMQMGSFKVAHPGKFRLSIRAVKIRRWAGELHYVLVAGPAIEDAKVVDVYPLKTGYLTLRYDESHGNTMFYNDVIVDESFPNTYFCSNGFENGYMGIQHNEFDGRKRAIFSVWDSVSQESQVATGVKDELAGVVRSGKGLTVKRFGREGTGYQSLYPFQWKDGEKVRLLQYAETGKEAGYVHYTGLIYLDDEKQWKLMATFKRRKSHALLNQCYSFLEDYMGRWGHVPRSVSFNPWFRKNSGSWVQSQKATLHQYFGDQPNINAWVANGRYYLRAGGNTVDEIKQHNNKLERKVNETVPDVLKDIDDIIKNEAFLP